MRFSVLLACALACAAPSDPIRSAIEKLRSGSEILHLQAENELARLGPPAVPAIDEELRKAAARGEAGYAARLRAAKNLLVSLRSFPMEVGHRWVYDSGRGEVVFEVTGKEKVHGIECFKVRRSTEGTTLFFYVTVSRKGVRIHRAGSEDFSPPFLEISFPLAAGRTWTWRGLIGGSEFSIRSSILRSETVETPAGRFEAHVVREELRHGDRQGWTDLWIADGWGVVKLQGKTFDLHNSVGGGFEWSLKSFTPR